MYIRYTQPPPDLWGWYEPYMEDEEEIDVKAGGGQLITIGMMVRQLLTKLDWYDTLFPRIPVPIQISIDRSLQQKFPPVSAVSHERAEPSQREREPVRRRDWSPPPRDARDRDRDRERDVRDRDRERDVRDRERDRDRDRERDRARGSDRERERDRDRERERNKVRQQQQHRERPRSERERERSRSRERRRRDDRR